MATSSIELSKEASKLGINLRGIYFKNTLPRKIEQGSYIINLDSYPGQGTHWLGLFVDSQGATYFDSFGVMPPDDVEQFIKKKYKGYRMNTSQIQDIQEGYCGQYVLLFLYYMTHMAPNAAEKFYNLFLIGE